MILFDYTQIVLSGIFEQIGIQDKNKTIEISLVRHMFFNIVKNYIKKFKREYKEVVFACDSKRYWRKEVFPHYKYKRRKNRDTSNFNWPEIFDALNIIKEELKQYSPYNVIEVDGAEADDVIAVLSQYAVNSNNNVIIISADSDFLQLQRHDYIKQYSPSQKKYLTVKDPDMFLKEKIIRGDADDIPNILSPDNSFVDNIRQKRLLTTNVEKWLLQSPLDFCNEIMLKYFHRNEVLIDFQHIPSDIANNIIKEYEFYSKKSKSTFLNYMIEYNLKNHIQDITDF